MKLKDPSAPLAPTPEQSAARFHNAVRRLAMLDLKGASEKAHRLYEALVARRREFPLYDSYPHGSSDSAVALSYPTLPKETADKGFTPMTHLASLRRELDKKRNHLLVLEEETSRVKDRLNGVRAKVTTLHRSHTEMSSILMVVKRILHDRKEHLEFAANLNEKIQQKLWNRRVELFGSKEMKSTQEWALNNSARCRTMQLLSEIHDLKLVAIKLRKYQQQYDTEKYI